MCLNNTINKLFKFKKKEDHPELYNFQDDISDNNFRKSEILKKKRINYFSILLLNLFYILSDHKKYT